jgi:hypothetical protein
MENSKYSLWQGIYFLFPEASENEKEQVQFITVHIFSFPVLSWNEKKLVQFLTVHIFSVSSGFSE